MALYQLTKKGTQFIRNAKVAIVSGNNESEAIIAANQLAAHSFPSSASNLRNNYFKEFDIKKLSDADVSDMKGIIIGEEYS